MPDKKLTDAEIVKALECCSVQGHFVCDECPAWVDSNCIGTHKQTLDLINRLQAKVIKEQNKNSKLRNERNRLQARVDDLERNDLPRCKDALRRANEMGIELQAENERLCAEVDELIISKDLLFDEAEALIKKAKAEAYKEFAELIKKDLNNPYIQKLGLDFVDFLKGVIDNRLKRMVGEDND